MKINLSQNERTCDVDVCNLVVSRKSPSEVHKNFALVLLEGPGPPKVPRRPPGAHQEV